MIYWKKSNSWKKISTSFAKVFVRFFQYFFVNNLLIIFQYIFNFSSLNTNKSIRLFFMISWNQILMIFDYKFVRLKTISLFFLHTRFSYEFKKNYTKSHFILKHYIFKWKLKNNIVNYKRVITFLDYIKKNFIHNYLLSNFYIKYNNRPSKIFLIIRISAWQS